MSPLFGKKIIKKEEKSNKTVVESKKNVDIKDVNLTNLKFDTYLQPYITEKTNDLSTQNKYVFLVLKRMNKVMIKHLVEDTYKVKVDKVNVIFLTVTPKRLGHIKPKSRKGGYKKAIVTLKTGYKIDLAI
jgi:large subunit ribosomal protein L23